MPATVRPAEPSAFEQLAQERAKKECVNFYGFNSRMIPETVQTSKPVYRQLNPRTEDELAQLERLKAKKDKKRKSMS